MMSPGWAPSAISVPATGVGMSTRDLSVSTVTTSWSSCTRSPTETSQSTISTSAMPSPMSGIRKS
jgi:hypothetical protein